MCYTVKIDFTREELEKRFGAKMESLTKVKSGFVDRRPKVKATDITSKKFTVAVGITLSHAMVED